MYIAYLSGDIVECMALSDNVVRVGLTPKYKDVETLSRMLQYSSTSISDCRIPPISLDECTVLYRPPVSVCEEFEVEVSVVRCGVDYTLRGLDCASVLLVWSGSGRVGYTSTGDLEQGWDGAFLHTLSKGNVLYLPAHVSMRCYDVSEDLVLYRAHVNCTLR